MKIALTAVGSFALFVKPIKLKQLVFFILIGAFTFTLIGLGRGKDSSEFYGENIFQRGYSNLQESDDDINFSNELASSVRIQYRALDVVPDKHPYLYGSTMLLYVIGIVPFAGSTVQTLLSIPPIYADTSVFFTFLGQGLNPSYGEGTEVIADIYVNFGQYGVFIWFFLFGAFTKNAFERAYNSNFNYAIVYIAFLMSALYLSRSHIMYPLKDMFYMLFFNWLFVKIIK